MKYNVLLHGKTCTKDNFKILIIHTKRKKKIMKKIIIKNWECDFVPRNTLSSLNLVEVQNQLQESQSKQNYFFFYK